MMPTVAPASAAAERDPTIMDTDGPCRLGRIARIGISRVRGTSIDCVSVVTLGPITPPFVVQGHDRHRR